MFIDSLKTDLRFAALKFAGGDWEAKRGSEEKPVKTVCNPIGKADWLIPSEVAFDWLIANMKQ